MCIFIIYFYVNSKYITIRLFTYLLFFDLFFNILFTLYYIFPYISHIYVYIYMYIYINYIKSYAFSFISALKFSFIKASFRSVENVNIKWIKMQVMIYLYSLIHFNVLKNINIIEYKNSIFYILHYRILIA